MRRQPRLRQSQPGGRLRRLGFQAYVTASQKPTQVSEDAGDTAVADNLVDAALAVNREQRLDSLGVEYKSLGRDLVRSRHDLGDRREGEPDRAWTSDCPYMCKTGLQFMRRQPEIGRLTAVGLDWCRVARIREL